MVYSHKFPLFKVYGYPSFMVEIVERSVKIVADLCLEC
jgi:hypothetical protein